MGWVKRPKRYISPGYYVAHFFSENAKFGRFRTPKTAEFGRIRRFRGSNLTISGVDPENAEIGVFFLDLFYIVSIWTFSKNQIETI